LRAHLRVTHLAADVQREREDDEHADEARVGDREGAEVQQQPALESLLPQKQEWARHQIRALAEQLRVGARGDRETEPGDRDRSEHEYVADDLEDRPEARMLAGEEL